MVVMCHNLRCQLYPCQMQPPLAFQRPLHSQGSGGRRQQPCLGSNSSFSTSLRMALPSSLTDQIQQRCWVKELWEEVSKLHALRGCTGDWQDHFRDPVELTDQASPFQGWKDSPRPCSKEWWMGIARLGWERRAENLSLVEMHTRLLLHLLSWSYGHSAQQKEGKWPPPGAGVTESWTSTKYPHEEEKKDGITGNSCGRGRQSPCDRSNLEI